MIGLLHQKKENDHRSTAECRRPVEDPFPAVVLGNEPAYNRCEVVASGEEEGVQAHVCAAFVGKVLRNQLKRL